MDGDQSIRTIVLAGLTSVLALSSGCTCGSTPGTRGEGKNGLELVVSKATYAAGEQVSISVNLTNRGTTPCQMIRLTDGVLTIQSMTRDGKSVVPKLTSSTYIDGLTTELLWNLIAVAPGGSISVPWESDVSTVSHHRLSLETATKASHGMADVAYWPVNQPGRYELTVNYSVPPMEDRAPADLCRIIDTATIGFVVAGGN